MEVDAAFAHACFNLILTSLAASLLVVLVFAHSQTAQTFLTSIATDISSVYVDLSGKHFATAAQMPFEDSCGSVLCKKMGLLTADRQLKAIVIVRKTVPEIAFDMSFMHRAKEVS